MQEKCATGELQEAKRLLFETLSEQLRVHSEILEKELTEARTPIKEWCRSLLTRCALLK